MPTVRLQSNNLSVCHLWQCRQAIGLATHFQMSKTRMRKQTQECLSTGFTNAEVRLDALWSIQPHRWKLCHASNFIKHPERNSDSICYLTLIFLSSCFCRPCWSAGMDWIVLSNTNWPIYSWPVCLCGFMDTLMYTIWLLSYPVSA